jgi:hypothetical protein
VRADPELGQAPGLARTESKAAVISRPFVLSEVARTIGIVGRESQRIASRTPESTQVLE